MSLEAHEVKPYNPWSWDPICGCPPSECMYPGFKDCWCTRPLDAEAKLGLRPGPFSFPLDQYAPKGPPRDYDTAPKVPAPCTGCVNATCNSPRCHDCGPDFGHQHYEEIPEMAQQADPALVEASRIEDTEPFKRLVVDMAVEQAGPDFDPFDDELAPDVADVSFTEDAKARTEYPMAAGLLDYFPNALAEVARLSHKATQQHHPDAGMHWDRSKSTEHADKIIRHLVDRHTVDDKGNPHWAMAAWRALAGLQEWLEARDGIRPSRASRNRPAVFGNA